MIPWCPTWKLVSDHSLWHVGMTILCPFIRSPLFVLSSSLWSQYCLAIWGTLFLLFGHPSYVRLKTIARIGSSAVASWCCLILSVVNPWCSILTSNLIVSSVGLGRQDSASTRSISFPGLYLIVQSNGWSCSNILCNLGGTAMRFFRAIIWSGLWSLSMMNFLPSK